MLLLADMTHHQMIQDTNGEEVNNVTTTTEINGKEFNIIL